MDKLPHEIQEVILGHLDVNDLARCGRVSRDVADRANQVLSTITCIYNEEDLFDDTDEPAEKYPQWHLCAAIKKRAPKNTSYKAQFTEANERSFLQFITKKCPRLSSLIALYHRILIQNISALADRITFLLIGKIITKRPCFKYGEDTIDAKSLAANFPKLRFYHFNYFQELCPNEVARAYSLLSPNYQLVKYDDQCYKRHESRYGCRTAVEARSIDHLFSISVNSPLVLGELRPFSLNSLKFLKLRGAFQDTKDLPHLPNLLCATLDCRKNLNNMIYLLHYSPKLSAVFLGGEIDMRSIPALNLLLSKCNALKTLNLAYDMNDNGIGDRPLDLSLCKSLKYAELRTIRLYQQIPEKVIRVIFPRDCGTVECYPSNNCFSKRGVMYEFGNAVSYHEMEAFAHPVELKIQGETGLCSIDEVLRLCPRVCRFTYSFSSHVSSEVLLTIFQSVLTKVDVSDILIDLRKTPVGECMARDLLGEINEYRERSFHVAIREIRAGYDLQLILEVLSRDYTMTYEDSEGGLEMRVEIPPAVNVLPTPTAE